MLVRRFNQHGDSIIEVLIAIAIVSLVLILAYSITSQNTRSIQANQERVQAQHLVEGQIELLRSQGTLTTSGDCFDASGNETSACNNFSQAGSGATYTVQITGPTSNVYTITANWTSLTSKTNNDSSLTMYYRLK